MSWIIRPMTTADIEAVHALEQTIPEAPHWSRSAYELCVAANESPQRAGFLVQKDEHLLGFAVGKLIAGIGEIESIAVVATARGQGIGLALVSAVAAWARQNGAFRLELEVRASNLPAIRLYQRAGLRQEGLRARYYDDPQEDAVLMGQKFDPVEN